MTFEATFDGLKPTFEATVWATFAATFEAPLRRPLSDLLGDLKATFWVTLGRRFGLTTPDHWALPWIIGPLTPGDWVPNCHYPGLLTPPNY